ncbi:MAG: tRNA glutamyl-Q(34) synthetase GluQRS [Rhizobiaceae bacterium]
MGTPVFRFAPSPNGRLHLGHAYSALLNARMADATGGRMLLRIEDIDTARCTPDFEAAIHDDLAWLGIGWERPVRRQSEHFADYGRLLEGLIGEGLVYPAFMSRGEIRAFIAARPPEAARWPHDPDGVPHYPGVEKAMSLAERRRRIAAGASFAWRLDMAAALARTGGPLFWHELTEGGEGEKIEARPQDWGDVILARRDVPTSYHLAVVADDALQGVTHVVRGRDLFAATAVQRLLQHLIGLPAPLYRHHSLILGADGRKLSKSERSTGLHALREAGRTPGDIRRMVGV